MNNQYETLLRTIGSLSNLDKLIQNNSNALLAFGDYLNQKKMICQHFANVANDLMEYLDNYDFTKGFSFNAVRAKIEAIGPLQLKLAEMDEAAKKLDEFPDCYGSKRIIKDCCDLLSYCKEKMKLDEMGKVLGWVEINSQKISDIQMLIVKDYNAFKAELLERKPDAWMEETERILAELSNGDMRVLYELIERYSNAKLKRKEDISNTKKKYTWLEGKRFRHEHEGLVAKYIPSVTYYVLVDKLKKERMNPFLYIGYLIDKLNSFFDNL